MGLAQMYFFSETGKPGPVPQYNRQTRAPRQHKPRPMGHQGAIRTHNADELNAQKDFAYYRLMREAALPSHYINGGYNVVFKTKTETHNSGESIKVFVWADNRTQAINKALRYVPVRVIENADEYVVTALPAGRVDPKTQSGVVPCPNR